MKVMKVMIPALLKCFEIAKVDSGSCDISQIVGEVVADEVKQDLE